MNIIVDPNQTMRDAFRRLHGRLYDSFRNWPCGSFTAAVPPRSMPRVAHRQRFVKPLNMVVATLLCAGMGGGAWAEDTAASAAASPAATLTRGVSTECLGVGEIVEKIALWRDAGGAPQRAQTEIARRITDPDARAVAVSLVTQLYTGFARQMTPAQARQAYTASCALAQANDERATAASAPTAPTAPAERAAPGATDVAPVRAP